jgi:outer membrane receptor protein involved in Fe transport
VQAYPNPDLKWEMTHSVNFGLDMSFFDHRLEMEVSAYYKRTNNAFMTKKVSSVNGISSYVINGGDVTNKGYSFDVTFTPIRNANFRWTLSTSISKVINTIDSRPDAQTYDLQDFLDGTALVKGQSVNTFYSYKFLGLSPVDGGPLFDDYADNPSVLRGLSKYDTYTTVLEASGKRDADIQGSLTNSFRYKNWHASFMLGYSFGAKTRLFAMYGSAASGGAYGTTVYPEKNYSRDYLKRWQNPGDESHTNIPAIMDVNSHAYYKYSRHWSDFSSYSDIPSIANNYWDMYDYSNIRVVSADYVKLQSISLTYDLEDKLLTRWGFQRMALTLSGYNLFTICDSALKGQTPTQGGFSTIQLSDRPSFSFGLNIIF